MRAGLQPPGKFMTEERLALGISPQPFHDGLVCALPSDPSRTKCSREAERTEKEKKGSCLILGVQQQ